VKGKKMREASAGQKEMLMQGKKPAKQAAKKPPNRSDGQRECRIRRAYRPLRFAGRFRNSSGSAFRTSASLPMILMLT
jgi:hypothetical protein